MKKQNLIRITVAFFFCVFQFFSIELNFAAENFSYEDLVHRLIDLEHLSKLPQDGEKCKQWSSYHRISTYDNKKGEYVYWDANRDGTGIIRMEDDKQVLAEMNGPGCIWRIWSARTGKGKVKIYLDGVKEPAVDMPFENYFNTKKKPFIYSGLVYESARGLNNYIPIPFQKSCKIVAEKDWGRYYHFTYSLFPETTKIPTFKNPISTAGKAALKKVNDFIIEKLGTDPGGKRKGEKIFKNTLTVKQNNKAMILDLSGKRALTSLKIKLNSKHKNISKTLRELILQITWDNEKQPAVWVPLGDFFGTAPGINHYKSIPMGMTEEGFYSFWYMPFFENARIELINECSSKVSLDFSITHISHNGSKKDTGRFHAKWHRDAFLPSDPNRKPDWTMLKTSGRGRFCGVMLHIWNPGGGWWGEGDEKFFVDGEKIPSTFGTGSEDYFGYAWCTPDLFQQAFHNQTYNDGTNMANQYEASVNRWQIADNVPFIKSFEGAMEKYFSNKKKTKYACTAYWYLNADGNDPYQKVPVTERINYFDPLKIETGVPIEGEWLKIIEKTQGIAMIRNMYWPDYQWSEYTHLRWDFPIKGDRLSLALPIEKAGKYELFIRLTTGRVYPKVQIYLDDKKLGAPIDCHSSEPKPTEEISFGIHNFKPGEHKLTFEITGKNPKIRRKLFFGLDYIKLQK